MLTRFVRLFGLFALIGLAQPTLAQSGFGVYGGLGVSLIKDDDGTSNFQGTGFGGNAGIDYRASNGVSFGFGVLTLGTAEDTLNGVDTEISVDAVELFVRYPFVTLGGAEIFGRLGGINYSADVEPGSNFNIFGDPAWDVGVGVDFVDNGPWAVRAEARYLNGADDESGGFASIGFRYGF